MIALLKRLVTMLDDRRRAAPPPELHQMTGTRRGFEVRGPREMPPIPKAPTITEILEGRQWRATHKEAA